MKWPFSFGKVQKKKGKKKRQGSSQNCFQLISGKHQKGVCSCQFLSELFWPVLKKWFISLTKKRGNLFPRKKERCANVPVGDYGEPHIDKHVSHNDVCWNEQSERRQKQSCKSDPGAYLQSPTEKFAEVLGFHQNTEILLFSCLFLGPKFQWEKDLCCS